MIIIENSKKCNTPYEKPGFLYENVAIYEFRKHISFWPFRGIFHIQPKKI